MSPDNRPMMKFVFRTTAPLLGSCLLALLLAACGSTPSSRTADVYKTENFRSDETFSRLFDGNLDDTCEAARRTLLSQGYVIAKAQRGVVTGTKHFQPDGEVHVEITFNIVCVADGKADAIATAYVSAQQDRYAVKRSTNATSIGVSAIGSISVPFSSTQDSLVKVASETIPAGEFYDRFFALMAKTLREQRADK